MRSNYLRTTTARFPCPLQILRTIQQNVIFLLVPPAASTEAMAGEAYSGDEPIVCARRGNLLFRFTRIAPNGDPTADVEEALATVLGL
jgi:hypothetical protein